MKQNLIFLMALLFTCFAFAMSPHDALDNESLAILTDNPPEGWFGQTNVTHDGEDAMQSGFIDDGQESILDVTTPVDGPAMVSFWWKVSSETNRDDLVFFMDFNPQASISGEADWQKQHYVIPEGEHHINWVYEKDSSGSSGSDCGWIDQLEIESLPSPTNALDNSSLNISTDNPPLGWFGQTNVTHDGEDALQSGDIGDNEYSMLFVEDVITGPARISFWWKVSSETNSDYLAFIIDENRVGEVSGETDWQKKQYVLAEGDHDIFWEYSTDGSGSAGSDCGWIDQLIITYVDADADGLPDEWEQQYFGGDQSPDAIASNGVNTMLEAYIVGLDPTDPDSMFVLTDLIPENDENRMHWTSVSGRVYSVYFSTNLLDGFQSLETNIPWSAGFFSDTNHTENDQMFYKIGVELAP